MSKKNAKKKRPEINVGLELWKAKRDFDRNKRLVLSGETFRSRKRRGPEKAPSHYITRY